MDWGVCFPRKDGNFDITTLHPYGKYTVSMTEPDLKQILVKKALAAGCRVENRTMAVGLLKEGGAVAGALGVNVRTGERILCTAKAVILAAGGTARFGLPPSGNLYGTYDYPGNTGDGYLLGYRAGASLTGMEFTLCYCLLKDLEAPGMAMMLQKGATLLDAAAGSCLRTSSTVYLKSTASKIHLRGRCAFGSATCRKNASRKSRICSFPANDRS